MATDLAGSGDIDGVRMTWNSWPRSKLEASKCVVPIAASFSPIRSSQDLVVLSYAPLRCKPPCSAYLNPFCRVDFSAMIWICPFCFSRNQFPPHYSTISESNVPGELYPQCTTVEYNVTQVTGYKNPVLPPVFLFVIDTCIIEEELEFLKVEMRRAVGLLPENALVGLITYGTQVHLHELGFADVSKVYVFRGTKEISKEQILDQLGLGGGGVRGIKGGVQGQQFQSSGVNRFLLPTSECEYTLNALLDELQTDQWPVEAGNRSLRCTGVALSVAAGLLGACLPGTGARIIALVGGPCTEGPGMIVSKDLSEPVRSHKDLDKDAAPNFHKAMKFYDSLAKQLVSQGHVLDLFASALDQIGVAEMKGVVERTGGLVVLAESFGHSVFKDSFKQIFNNGEESLGLSFNGTLEINCSKDIKIQGIIGPCTSLEKKSALCSDTVVGQGNTIAWKMCGLDRSTCLTVFFDISPSDKSQSGIPNPQLYLQFVTHYQNFVGEMRTRVTTVARQWVDDSSNKEELVGGFDQETAAVVLARFVSLKMEMELMDPTESSKPLKSCSIGTSTNTEERLKSLQAHLKTEAEILERLIYKNKNQHRRCPYFQALLKVRRNLRLLMSAGLADISNVMFSIVYSKQPAKNAFAVKRQKKDCNKNFGIKHNYQQRLLGVARILSQMVEPILFAATQISYLLAKSFFSSFSLIILALLARLRVLVQQILLDVVFVYNTVSSLSTKKHSVKIMKGGIEAYREYQPCSEEAITLECVWENDKFVLVERKNDSHLQNKKDDDDEPLLSEMPVKYETIQLFSEDMFIESKQNLEEILPAEIQLISEGKQIESNSLSIS